ncbi:ketopantoate reductase family protein [Oceanirhabdus sp. W0125-5]|uniref:ketopantoate reductase family protein n=1 Tax=Oceanirhabdus sp. W0125-5 TaxID=2999116 RepID=UPI0022F3110C|nr:ketopantoate reductase family protein [Oceanirhabdus sp. W0125-5]WBW95595.1 ketopantoate reductase family protein [Oceanirhabdus sp. W0125-5]
MKKVLFLGLGAIGATFASQFSNAGYKFSVICDNKRKERYLKDGFIVNKKRYDFDYVTKEEYNDVADLIIISVKYNDLKESIEQLDGIIGDNTIILSLLNGIDSEDIIANKFGYNNLLYSFVGNGDSTKSGNVINHSNKGKIVFGEKDGRSTKKTNEVVSIFNEAQILYDLSHNIIRDMWWKYMVNIGMNQTTAVLKAPYRVYQKNEYAREVAKGAMREVIQIANVMDVDLGEEDIDKVFEMIMKLAPTGKTSMFQDVEAKRITEVDMLSGKLCELGCKYNIPTPVNQMLYNMIKTIECMYIND